MKLSTEQTNRITEKFQNLQDTREFLKLLNLTKTFMYGHDCKPVLLKSVTWYANPRLSRDKRYRTFSIPKKSGELREIHAPVVGLKSILKILNVILNCVSEPHKKATGFIQGKSIVDNARMHVNKRYVYNVDLKDFFHSFDRNRVKMGIWYNLFEMEKKKEPIAFLIAALCTHPIEVNGELKTVLPQGSPASPTITNILCKNLDRRLNGLAKRFNLRYSRYADDITFSSYYNVFNKEEFYVELNRIVREDQKLEFNSKKTRLQKTGYRQEVTGLIVNEKVNVRRSYLKEIRMYLYYWEKYGYEKANGIYQKGINPEKFKHKWVTPQLKNVLDVKLEFLKMVKGAKDSSYLKLVNKFSKLSKRNEIASENLALTDFDISKVINQEIIDELLEGVYKDEKMESHKHKHYSNMVDLIAEKGLNEAIVKS